eukprot:CAMPEP_0119009812 /NCGR_PEP_ID=MMETSP1176-20130426/4614_1 /TAXON_ID=265551 /ORGANISM="Synedropsis recta cf, Strain CCMP1620" /LENGTH=217 /DNA_ID=CAMNT_0006962391 /DNA_START=51 /DNA_END=704 /DNA_ORIENTATION=-
MGGNSIEYNVLPVVEVVAEQRRSSCNLSRILVLVSILSLFGGGAVLFYCQQHPSTKQLGTPSNLRPPNDPDDYFHQFDHPTSSRDDYPEMHDSEGQPMDNQHPDEKDGSQGRPLDAPNHDLPRPRDGSPPPHDPRHPQPPSQHAAAAATGHYHNSEQPLLHPHDGPHRPEERNDPLFPPPPDKIPKDLGLLAKVAAVAPRSDHGGAPPSKSSDSLDD